MNVLAAVLAVAICGAPGGAIAEVYVCAGDSVRVFADDASTSDPPIRVVQSADLYDCYGVALDNLHHELWVSTGASVSVFSASADGVVAPLRSISASGEGLGFVVSVAVDVEAGEVFVGSADGKISVFSRTANGPTAPLRTIDGDLTQIANAAGLFVDRVHDELFAANFAGGFGVYVFPRAADGNVAPSRSFGAAGPNLGIVVDPRVGELFLAHGNEISKYTLSGSTMAPVSTGSFLTSAFGLVLHGDGQILVVNQSTNAAESDWIFSFATIPGGPTFPFNMNAAQANRSAWGMVSSRSVGCSEGNVAGYCLFRDGFERGDRLNWSLSFP